MPRFSVCETGMYSQNVTRTYSSTYALIIVNAAEITKKAGRIVKTGIMNIFQSRLKKPYKQYWDQNNKVNERVHINTVPLALGLSCIITDF